MTPSKTYLKFQETRSKEDLDTLNGYLLRLQQISVILLEIQNFPMRKRTNYMTKTKP